MISTEATYFFLNEFVSNVKYLFCITIHCKYNEPVNYKVFVVYGKFPHVVTFI